MQAKPAKRGTKVVYPNVSRLDYDKAQGYSVRFERDGVKTTKLFSDVVYGGKRKAHAAAIKWRNETLALLPPPMLGGHQGGVKPPGYSYVKRMTVTGYSAGCHYQFAAFVAFLRIEDRKHLVTRWSIDKWGESIARRGCEKWVRQKKHELRLREGARRANQKPPMVTPMARREVKLVVAKDERRNK